MLPGKEAFHSSHRGHVKNITLKNIQVLDGKLPYSVFNGFDKDHIVDGIHIDNMTVGGKRIKNKEDLKLYTKFTENVTIK